MADLPTESRPLSSQADAAREHFERALRLVMQARVGLTPEDRRAAFTAAASELEKVLAIDPTYPGARTNLGYCLIELGRHGEAKREIEQALRESPQDVSALINYAVILQYNQRVREAETYLRQAVALDPRQGYAYRDLAYLLEQRRRFRAAADNLERYLELTPHANDERAVRYRIKLLRQRAGMFELPDRAITPEGITADLRRRGAAVLLDGTLFAALWLLSMYLANHVTWLESFQRSLFVSLVYLYHLLSLETLGSTFGKMALNLRVRSAREADWFSPLAVRETLKLAPILIGFLFPFPWNLLLVALFILIGGYSALRHRQGQAWYDRPTHTQVVEWGYGWGRMVASLICLASLLVAIFSWRR